MVQETAPQLPYTIRLIMTNPTHSQGRTPPFMSRFGLRKPRFLIDDTLPQTVEEALRRKGYKATFSRRIFHRGTSQDVLLAYAKRNNCIIVTKGTPYVHGESQNAALIEQVFQKIRDVGW